MTEIPEDIRWLAERYELEPRAGESEAAFRERVAGLVFEEGNDPLLFVEVLAGKDYKDFNPDESGAAFLATQLMRAKKQMLMQGAGDTYYDIPYAEFIPIAEGAGFERVHHHTYLSHERVQQYAVWAKHELGFLLTSSSYVGLNQETLNDAHLHYELNFQIPYEEFSDNFWEMYRRGVKGSNSSPNFEPSCTTRVCSVDVGERFLGVLYEIEHCGLPTNSPWQYFGDHFLWLLDHNESYDKELDKDSRMKERIISLPDKTKILMGIEELCN